MPDYINRADIMAFPIRADHCDRKHANEHFINGIETVMEYVENLKPVSSNDYCSSGVRRGDKSG